MNENIPGYRRIETDTRYRAKYLSDGWLSHLGRELTHYTSIKGLVGIIQSGGFWLSDHRFLNDSEEYHNGRKLVHTIITRLMDKKRHAHFREILARTADLLKEEKEPAQYVCAFSTKTDSLDQWRAYAPGEQGVALTFENVLDEGHSHFSIPPTMKLYRIVYCDDIKTMMLTRTIAKFSRECRKDTVESVTIEKKQWAQLLSSALAIDFITFKHASYENEAETRMVVASGNVGQFETVHHRVTKNKIVPYITSADLYGKSPCTCSTYPLLPLKEIRVGPTATQQMTLRSIEEFLAHAGYGHVPVLKSGIPFRG